MYNVGQVVFVISDKHRRVLPVRVVEQVVRRTLDGESIEYRVQGTDPTQTFALNSIGKTHFSSAQDIKNYMIENARSSIVQIVDEALSLAVESYGYTEQGEIKVEKTVETPQEEGPAPDIFVNSENEETVSNGTTHRVKLPDGTYASVNMTIPGL